MFVSAFLYIIDLTLSLSLSSLFSRITCTLLSVLLVLLSFLPTNIVLIEQCVDASLQNGTANQNETIFVCGKGHCRIHCLRRQRGGEKGERDTKRQR